MRSRDLRPDRLKPELHATPCDSKRPFQHFSFSAFQAFHRPAAAPQNCKSPLFLRGSLRWGRNSKSCFPANEVLTRILTETCIDDSSAKRDKKEEAVHRTIVDSDVNDRRFPWPRHSLPISLTCAATSSICDIWRAKRPPFKAERGSPTRSRQCPVSQSGPRSCPCQCPVKPDRRRSKIAG